MAKFATGLSACLFASTVATCSTASAILWGSIWPYRATDASVAAMGALEQAIEIGAAPEAIERLKLAADRAVAGAECAVASAAASKRECELAAPLMGGAPSSAYAGGAKSAPDIAAEEIAKALRK